MGEQENVRNHYCLGNPLGWRSTQPEAIMNTLPCFVYRCHFSGLGILPRLLKFHSAFKVQQSPPLRVLPWMPWSLILHLKQRQHLQDVKNTAFEWDKAESGSEWALYLAFLSEQYLSMRWDDMISSYNLLFTSELPKLCFGHTHGLTLVITNLLAFREAKKSLRLLGWAESARLPTLPWDCSVLMKDGWRAVSSACWLSLAC